MPEPNLDRWARDVVEQSTGGSVGRGLGLTVVFHFVVQAPLFFILLAMAKSEQGLALAIYSVMYIGLTQFVYMIPAIIFARRRGETKTAKGLIVGASFTFLLTATCNGFWVLGR